ncbi:MAG: 3-keto-5-aminohexanoate cleavage protein, partial [Actinobacteria bacterium]|nr:3-keto-5-aminohexanoate cleavage protein [Actinomycetota bacterium]
ALPAWPGIVSFLAEKLPRGATWSATGIGKAHLQVTQEALEAGGHVRTGFEDVRYLGRGQLARSNAELIKRVAEMGEKAGRKVTSVQEARSILGLL